MPIDNSIDPRAIQATADTFMNIIYGIGKFYALVTPVIFLLLSIFALENDIIRIIIVMFFLCWFAYIRSDKK